MEDRMEKTAITTKQAHRALLFLLRLLLGVLLLLLVLTGAGWFYQRSAAAADEKNFPAPGERIDVGDAGKPVFLHLYCTGSREPDQPVVVLEGGSGEWSSFWGSVQPQVARSTRVCSYDREGYGWSDPVSTPRTAQQIAGELHRLLEKAGEPGPYLLVTHSAGGLYTRYFQKVYSNEVAGMVLVESHSEDLFIPLPDVFTSSQPVFQLCQQALTPVGLVRLTHLLPQFAELAKLPQPQQAPALARLNRADFCGTAYAETAGLQQSAEQLRDVDGSLGSLPLVVIRATNRPADDWPDEPTWAAAQQKLARLSSRGSLVLAQNSTHYVQLDEPQIVVQAIQTALEETAR
jgi:pimeloyl-ACP methyl ester carboxylesterase